MDVRDRCCWKRCRDTSDIIFLGAGLCDSHFVRACQVYLPTTDFILGRVIPEAVLVIREQIKVNKSKK